MIIQLDTINLPIVLSTKKIFGVPVRWLLFFYLGPSVEALRKLLHEHPEINDKQTMIVNFNAFAPSSLDFFVYTFTHTTNWVRYHEIKHNVSLKILDIITAHGAEMAFPSSTVYLPDAATLGANQPDPVERTPS